MFWKKSELALNRKLIHCPTVEVKGGQKRRKMSDNPDRSYSWYKAHCFNDYMERIIGIAFIIIIIIIITITITITITFPITIIFPIIIIIITITLLIIISIVINDLLNDYMIVILTR